MLAFLEALVPGLRSLRPPIFAGIGWCLFFWLLSASQIPDQSSASGWLGQVYAIGNFIGPAAVMAATLVVAFIVGAVAQSLTEPLSRLVGRATGPVSRRLSRRSPDSYMANLSEAVREVRADELRGRLSQVTVAGRTYAYEDEIFRAVLDLRDQSALESRLSRELSGDPIELVRMFDREASAEMERARAERAVRLAIAYPLVATGVLAVTNYGFWPGLFVVFLGVAMIFRYTADQSDERERALALMMLRSGNSPAMTAIRTVTQYDLEEYVAKSSPMADGKAPS